VRLGLIVGLGISLRKRLELAVGISLRLELIVELGLIVGRAHLWRKSGKCAGATIGMFICGGKVGSGLVLCTSISSSESN
jgi:hypothetical protein